MPPAQAVLNIRGLPADGWPSGSSTDPAEPNSRGGPTLRGPKASYLSSPVGSHDPGWAHLHHPVNRYLTPAIARSSLMATVIASSSLEVRSFAKPKGSFPKHPVSLR